MAAERRQETAIEVTQKMSDADMLWYGIDRTDRQTTSPSEVPTDKLNDVREGLAKFRKLRAAMLKYASTTDDDLRGHAFPDWGVNLDTYQAFFGISAHAQRHILQIREVKAQPGYPKKQGMKNIERLSRLGRVLFALSMMAFGIQNVITNGVVIGLELTPEWLPVHIVWAYLMGAVLIAGGICIAIDKKVRLAATAVGVLYLASVLLLRLPKLSLMYDVGERTRVLEPLGICCAAIVLAGTMRLETTGSWTLDNLVDHVAGPARVILGLCMIMFGADHFEVLHFIATLIPSWMPGSLFLAAFTGIAMIAAGLSIVTRWQMRLASMLLGLMFFLWVVLLHAPRVAGSLGNGNEWNSLFVALTMCAAGWILAGVPSKHD